MANLPKNLPEILRKHGLKVVEIDGWEDRGRPGSFDPVGVLCHHTAGHDDIGDAADDLAYVKNVLVKGRADLSGPLCQLALSAEGVVYIVAAGRANHAGDAKKSGTVAAGNGNTLYIGIEAMNAGNGKDKWEKSQYDAYVLLCAVLSVEITKNSHATVRAHRETSVTGKIDPAGPTPYEGNFDMTKFRTRVKAKMVQVQKGTTKPAPAKPTAYDKMDPDSYFGGVEGPHVSWLMGRLIAHGVTKANGNVLTTKTTQWGPTAVEAVAIFQAKHKGWAVSGVPGPLTLKALAAAPAKAPAPKPAPADGKGELRVGFHNIKVGRSDASYEKGIRAFLAEKPDIAFLAEAKDVHRKLGFVESLGYTAKQQAPKARYAGNVSESANIAVLVRDGVTIKVNKLIPQNIGFVGPKVGARHDPRVHRYMVVNKDDFNWPVAGIHGPFGGDPVAEMCKLLTDWIEDEVAAHGRAVIVGDWNMSAEKVEARVAKPAGATVDGAGIDLAVFRGCTKVEGENLDKLGSDHDAKIWTFKN